MQTVIIPVHVYPIWWTVVHKWRENRTWVLTCPAKSTFLDSLYLLFAALCVIINEWMNYLGVEMMNTAEIPPDNFTIIREWPKLANAYCNGMGLRTTTFPRMVKPGPEVWSIQSGSGWALPHILVSYMALFCRNQARHQFRTLMWFSLVFFDCLLLLHEWAFATLQLWWR